VRARALAVLLTLAAGPALGGEPDDLAKAAHAFYDVYLTLHPSDGIPDKATQAKFVPVVSPALLQLFVDGDAAEDRYAKATKNQSPPLIEGDLFTPNFEGATSYVVGTCVADAAGGHCPVTLTYDDHKDKPFRWTDTVFLVRTQQGFRVDDIAYGGTWDFGNKGRLTRTLKGAIADGNAVPH
jgi:hypothetical protein